MQKTHALYCLKDCPYKDLNVPNRVMCKKYKERLTTNIFNDFVRLHKCKQGSNPITPHKRRELELKAKRNKGRAKENAQYLKER